MDKKLSTQLFFLLTIFSFITFSQGTKATDVCSPYKMDYQKEAESRCPAVCATPKYGGWSGNWSPTSKQSCDQTNNQQGSVCGCKDCTTVTVDYHATNWYASAWYTACGSTSEASTAWNIDNIGGYTKSIASGSKFRIGPAGSNDVYLTSYPTGDNFLITCAYALQGNPKCFEGNVEPSGKDKKQQSQGSKKSSKPTTK